MKILIAIVSSLLSFATSASAGDAVDLLNRLEGKWHSNGKAFGAPADSDMVWALALDGQFMSLDYRIVMRPGGDEVRTFSGVAFYDMKNGDAAFWADSSGDIHPIRTEIAENALTAHWGKVGEKQGRTRYELTADGSVNVTDWILTADGWRRFNENKFVRQPEKTTE